MPVEGQYLYAIVEGPGRRNPQGAGLGERPVVLIPARGLAALASESPLCPYAADACNASRHAAVVEEAMRGGPVLPVRFGAVLRGREAVVALLEAQHDVYLEALCRLRGKVEMAVRVLWDPGRARGGARPREGGEGECEPAEPLRGPGRGYLLRKLHAHRMAEAARERGERLIARIDGVLRPLAADGVARRCPTARLLLDAAYLVAHEAQPAFREAVERLGAQMAEPRFLLTGPWPPYSFVPGCNPGEA